jgi:hypothetical protein
VIAALGNEFKHALKYSFLLALLVIVSACESNMAVQSPSGDDFVSRTRAQAVKLEQAGDLARAVYQWQVVVGLQANDSQAKSELIRLRKKIAVHISRYESEYAKARNAGNPKKQKLFALKLLALDGEHKVARQYLSKFERDSALITQSRKDRDALQAQAARQYKAGQALTKQKQEQQKEKDRLLVQAKTQEELAASNAQKADDLYREGIKALSVDLDKAIELLSESLKYNSDNVQAEQHIQRARKMQATLRKIEKNQSQK